MNQLYEVMCSTTRRCCGVTTEFAKKRGKKVAVMGAVALLTSGVVSAQIQSDPTGPRPDVEGRLSKVESDVTKINSSITSLNALQPKVEQLEKTTKNLSSEVEKLKTDNKVAGEKEQQQDKWIADNKDKATQNKADIDQLKPKVEANTEELNKVDGKITTAKSELTTKIEAAKEAAKQAAEQAKTDAITEAGKQTDTKIENAKNELTNTINTSKREAIAEAGTQADEKITKAKADIAKDIATAKNELTDKINTTKTEAIAEAGKQTDAKIATTKTEFDGKLKDLSDKTVKIEQHNKDIAQLKAVEQAHEVRIANVEKDVKQVGASAAALAALKVLPFQGGQRTQVMAGVGTYRGQTAMALGVAHYANQHLMYHGGISFGGTHGTMANAGVTIGFGSGETTTSESSKVAALQSVVARLTAENEQVKAALHDIYAKLQAK